MNRRQLLGAGAMLVGTSALAQTSTQSVPEAPLADSARTQVPPRPSTGRDYNPVVTLNGWSLPWRMNGNVKEFHLIAEPVERELAEGTVAQLWGYNGMIESPAELLDAIRGRLDAQLSEAAARADYWRADAGLTAALYGGGDGAPAGGGGGAALASAGGGAGH